MRGDEVRWRASVVCHRQPMYSCHRSGVRQLCAPADRRNRLRPFPDPVRGSDPLAQPPQISNANFSSFASIVTYTIALVGIDLFLERGKPRPKAAAAVLHTVVHFRRKALLAATPSGLPSHR